jgi:hypothetical protein
MILSPDDASAEPSAEPQVDEYVMQYEAHNTKLKTLEEDLERMTYRIRDKDKIIGLYEFMLNNKNHATTVGETR